VKADSDVYAGTKAFSEKESKAVKQFVEKHKNLAAFISLHSYGQTFMFPYADRRGHYPADYEDLKRIASRAVQNMNQLRVNQQVQYTAGSMADVIGLTVSTGGSADWAKKEKNIKYTYAIELRPHRNANLPNNFHLPHEQIIDTGIETWEDLKVVADEVIRCGRNRRCNIL